MKITRTVGDLRRALDRHRTRGDRVGFVPTMGALHEGHLSLIRRARESSQVVVLSIFVNPLQFGAGEDLEAYPRDEARDLLLAESEGVDVAFVPPGEEMYPRGQVTTRVDVGGLATILEGAHRPGHFEGVATVVAKLFHIVEPDVAIFGQKDAQQVAVIRKMVDDLSFRTEVEVSETVREKDGLAMSSRNAYLQGPDRDKALALRRALLAGRAQLEAGDGPGSAETAMTQVFRAEGLTPDYARAVDPVTFEEPHGDVLLLVAARVGPARLIDNLLVKATG